MRALVAVRPRHLAPAQPTLRRAGRPLSCLGGDRNNPCKAVDQEALSRSRKSTKLGSSTLQVLNADSTRNRTAHPNMDTKTHKKKFTLLPCHRPPTDFISWC